MSAEQPIKRIAIFGSTGSIGTQALDVIAANKDKFSAEVLTAQSNDDLLIRQALQFNPNVVVIGDEKKYAKVKEALSSTDIKVFSGEKALKSSRLIGFYEDRDYWGIGLCRRRYHTAVTLPSQGRSDLCYLPEACRKTAGFGAPPPEGVYQSQF